MHQACVNLGWAAALFGGLADGGMRRLVLSPGSRSTPLVLAAERHPDLTLTTILDERDAAFFALGLARATRCPVGLVATSGSAPAHWYPAVIEAAEWGVPLVLLSADRPPELRAWGANQTVDQLRLFGTHVREFHDPGPPRPGAERMLAALGRRVTRVGNGVRPGPVHVNLPFPEPLVPDRDCGLPPPPPAVESTPSDLVRFDWPSRLAARPPPRGVILCGPDDYPPTFAPALWRMAEALGWPVLTDPLSGLRGGSATALRVTHYDALLRHPEAAVRLRPDWVLRFGRAPVSKTLSAWLREVPTLLVDPAERWIDPDHNAVEQLRADLPSFCDGATRHWGGDPDPTWSAAWRHAEQRVAALAAAHLAESAWGESQLLQTLLARLPVDCDVFVANSLPVRQLDTWSGAWVSGPRIFCNRGASGIDGHMATLAGLNAGGRPTLGVIGDLAFWHNVGGLLLSAHWRAPLVVINNGGGGIFGYLSQTALAGFERFWRTPVDRDIGAVVRAFGMTHRLATDGASFATALEQAVGGAGPTVIEVQIDAAGSRAAHQAYWRSVSEDPELSGPRG